MFNWRVSEISRCISGEIFGPDDQLITSVQIDSRTSALDKNTVFVALKGPNHDGHKFIPDLITKGIKAFIIEEEISIRDPEISFIKVPNSLKALQELARWHRESFKGKVVAITGSNGKTIVKEWLSSILSNSYSISKSPKSYNSQVGVALSILEANPLSDFCIFEAGISKPGEMRKLQRMIRPDIGLITNIGDAHQENFSSLDQKLAEKLILFESCTKIFYCQNHELVDKKIQAVFHENIVELIGWKNQLIEDSAPFKDHASLENLSHVYSLASSIGIPNNTLQSRIQKLEAVAMRMEQTQGIQGCTLINDYYNSDFQSVKNAIDLLWQQTPQKKKTLIISDILQSGEPDENIISRLTAILKGCNFYRIIGIGKMISKASFLTHSFQDTESFLRVIETLNFKDEAILLKGARIFKFEQISSLLEEKIHRTVLRINMPTLRNNYNLYRNSLDSDVKIMGMVKALSYGSGTHEVARFLAHQNIDYLAVAFIDEGVKLREAGVVTPIMVMNPDFMQVGTILKYKLEPEIFNLRGFQIIDSILKNKGILNYPVHLKLDTGMHRLGFNFDQLKEAVSKLDSKHIRIASIFSHLAASGDPSQDKFTLLQIAKFNESYDYIQEKITYKPLKHILNTSGIERFKEAHFNMVRLGIGLYGFGGGQIKGLESPILFQSYISQIHNLKKGESIGYERLGQMEEDGEIGIIPVGYADGFDRRLGNGNWNVSIGTNKTYPTVGQVCMDMCMIDLTHSNAREGDVVTIIDGKSGISEMAKALNTIPYEILTGFSSRITRVYEFD